MTPRITFLGGVGEVTGSRYLVETGRSSVLVDCGMFQGGGGAFRRNRAPFGFAPAAIDCVLLTHAHIDHSGLLPRLVREGFRGAIHCTPPTADLLEVMLHDTAHILESEARFARERRAKRRGRVTERIASALEPVYTAKDVDDCLARLRPVRYDEPFRPAGDMAVVLREAGHILGSASIEIDIGEAATGLRLVCSGDLGSRDRPLVRDPAILRTADALLIESTYGNRLHRPLAATIDEFAEAVGDTLAARRGNVVIPAFAVGRTQEVLFLLGKLCREARLPPMDVYVDSPMATKATGITMRHLAELDEEAKAMFAWMHTARNAPRVRFVDTVEDSIALNRIRSGAIIISVSGMCDAGRIRHHLKNNLGRAECTIVIPGFQAKGTLGRRIVDGERTVRLFGDEVPVRARIYTIGGLSAHADQEGLLGWLARFERAPRHLFAVHGEPEIAAAFTDAIRDRLGWKATAPAPGDTVSLS